MNYLFRPTPVVTLGRDRGADRVTLSKTPAGMMLGGPGATSRMPSRSLATQGAPWIVRSGTMASFGTLGNVPCGCDCAGGLGCLGQDDGSDLVDTGSTDFYSGAFANPSLPVDSSGLPTDFFGGAGATPILPTTATVQTPTDLNALAPSYPTIATSPGMPAAPAGQAGSGVGLPGTTPLAPSTSLLQNLTNLLTPKPPTAYSAIPGVGVNPRAVVAPATVSPTAGQFLGESTLVSGVPNSTVIFGGLAALILLGVAFGGKK